MEHMLPIGANTVLQAMRGDITVQFTKHDAIDVSLTAFLLTAEGKVLGDEGIVFYNQPTNETGMATLQPAKQVGQTIAHTLQFDFTKAPASIVKMAITLTEDNGTGFANVHDLVAHIRTDEGTIQLTPQGFQQENGIVVAELYIHSGQLKAKSIWRGFNSGLQGLCENYGVEVEAAETPVEQKPEPKPTINLEKVTGKVSLSKGQKSVLIEKTPEITATVEWETGTDYDIYALVYTRDGQQVDVAMFGAKGVRPLQSYKNAVTHMGDVGRSDGAHKQEVIKLRLTDDVLAVVPVVYSAQSNGTGSFYRYEVSMSIDNHQGTSVTIHAKNANNNDRIYTCVPGVLHNTSDGVMITPLELYSSPNSENRPKLKIGSNNQIEVLMDQGPKNDYK